MPVAFIYFDKQSLREKETEKKYREYVFVHNDLSEIGFQRENLFILSWGYCGFEYQII